VPVEEKVVGIGGSTWKLLKGGGAGLTVGWKMNP
jgi:hypothetical protein